MEASRLNIVRERVPTLILLNKEAVARTIDVGEKGQLDAELEIVGIAIEPDENGNEIMKYTLRIVKASKFDIQGTRL